MLNMVFPILEASVCVVGIYKQCPLFLTVTCNNMYISFNFSFWFSAFDFQLSACTRQFLLPAAGWQCFMQRLV